MISKKKKQIPYIIFIFLFSILLNQYYGYIGINPIDSFFSFNSGYDTLRGYYPFKDYWTITGPFITFTQAILFKILGVSWFSYVFHASILNFILAIATFFTLYNFKLNINYCFFYSLLISLIGYPSIGTPYVDHHSAYISTIALFCFILAIKTDSKIYWFFLPIILGIAFLTKQAPTGHFFLIISFLSIFNLIIRFDLRKIIYGLLGSAFIILLFLLILKLGKIPFSLFYDQYILFPLSLGEDRLEFLLPLEFKRIILRYKIIHLPLLFLIIISVKKILQSYKFLLSNDFIIILSLILSSFALIIHQLMTINGMFIFFVIPILMGFSHAYYLKYFKTKKSFTYFIILLSVTSSVYYFSKYVHSRDFHDLRNADKKEAVNAKIINKKLSGLKWITPLHPKSPDKEISQLLKVIEIIKGESKMKTIITDYQFISVIINEYDYSPSQVWFNYHVNPTKESKYFNKHKNFLNDRLKKNDIEVIYIIKPLWGGDNVLEKSLNKTCHKIQITEILDKYLLKECDDL